MWDSLFVVAVRRHSNLVNCLGVNVYIIESPFYKN